VSGVFAGMLMGPSGPYYLQKLRTLYDMGDVWTWTQVFKTHPTLTKSDLSRFKFSGYILKAGHIDKYTTTLLWKLHPKVKIILKEKKYL
jgi:hypothetical protein